MTVTREDFKITEAFGSEPRIAFLFKEAIAMAMATGSIGATVEDCELNENFETITVAKVRVARI